MDLSLIRVFATLRTFSIVGCVRCTSPVGFPLEREPTAGKPIVGGRASLW